MKCHSKAGFRSSDERFALLIGKCRLAELYAYCAASHPLETGGVLIGHYNGRHDTAIVSVVTGPSPDSISRPTSYYRGTRQLQKLLTELWPKQEYYLGEWHYHPNGSAQPSVADTRQMQDIAKDTACKCPEPVLLVIGANHTVTAQVFPRNEAAVPLNPVHKELYQGGAK